MNTSSPLSHRLSLVALCAVTAVLAGAVVVLGSADTALTALLLSVLP